MNNETLNFKKNFIQYLKETIKNNKTNFFLASLSYIVFLISYFFMFYYFSILISEIFKENTSIINQNICFAIILSLIIISTILDYLYYYFLFKIISKFILNIKKNMYIKLAIMDEKEFINDEINLFKLFFFDIVKLENDFTFNVLCFFKEISLIIFSFIVGLINHSILFLSSVIYLPITIIIFTILVLILKKIKRKLNTYENNSISKTYETFKYSFLFSQYNVDKIQASGLKNNDNNYRRYSSYYSIFDNIINSIFSISYFLSILFLILISSLYLNNNKSISFINIIQVGFISLIFNILLSECLIDFKDLILMKDNVSNIKKIVNYSIEDENLININKINSISFKNVYYEIDKKKILNDFSLDISKDENIAIVGQIASGKTTIINLLLKRIKPTNGNIYINGIDIKNISKKSINNLISCFDNNSYIYNTTLKNNIILNKEISDDELNKVIKLVELDSLIDDLKDGINTIIDFYSLSKSEKEKISFARNIIKNGDVFIFDHTFSSFDEITSNTMLNNISKLIKDKIVINICHVKSILEKSDYILVIKDGNLVEKGKIDDLLSVNGFFATLYKEGFSFE